jgi:DNA-binding XRE family transcriptional regulator
MTLLRNSILAFFVSIVMMSSTVIAEEEISQESVIEALNKTIELSEETVSAIENGAKAEDIERLYRKIKRTVKGVIISDSKSAVPKSKAAKRIRKSRKAFRKGDFEKAAKLAAEAVKFYKQTLSNKI